VSKQASIGAECRVVGAEHVRCRRFDDELVMVDLQGGEYFALDAVGARMWELLIAGETPASVATKLSAEFAASEEEIRRDCTNLANELLQRGLVVRLP
jgi:hypothetical protein